KERELSDAHARVERDRDGVHVAELERDVPVPCGVDEAGGGMDEEAKSAERRLPLDATHQVVGEADAFACRSEDELAGMKDEALVLLHFDELGDVIEGL